jgi:hypothetical protein
MASIALHVKEIQILKRAYQTSLAIFVSDIENKNHLGNSNKCTKIPQKSIPNLLRSKNK